MPKAVLLLLCDPVVDLGLRPVDGLCEGRPQQVGVNRVAAVALPFFVEVVGRHLQQRAFQEIVAGTDVIQREVARHLPVFAVPQVVILQDLVYLFVELGVCARAAAAASELGDGELCRPRVAAHLYGDVRAARAAGLVGFDGDVELPVAALVARRGEYLAPFRLVALRHPVGGGLERVFLGRAVGAHRLRCFPRRAGYACRVVVLRVVIAAGYCRHAEQEDGEPCVKDCFHRG